MSLTYVGPNGSVERRWIVYAMLRDNVQHHLEKGEPTSEYARLHSLGKALVTGTVSVPALELRAELSRLEPLLELPIDDLAISLRTQAVLILKVPLPTKQSTMLASEVGWEPPFPLAGAATLRDAFGSLVTELLEITEGATPVDAVSVIDS